MSLLRAASKAFNQFAANAAGFGQRTGGFDVCRRSGIMANAATTASRHFRTNSQPTALEKQMQSGWISRLTVNALKDELRARKLKVSGRKAELIERLMLAI